MTSANENTVSQKMQMHSIQVKIPGPAETQIQNSKYTFLWNQLNVNVYYFCTHGKFHKNH